MARHYGPHGEAGRNEITVFIEVFAPPRRMLIFGAVDFTAALVRVAKVLGYHVTVCDARPVFATSARFPEADEVVADWPHRYLAKVADRLGPEDAICVLTHDHKFDIPALVAALKTKVGYLGAMGSRGTHDGRVERLRAEGVDPADIRRIMAPIGHRYRCTYAGGDGRLHLRRDHLPARRGEGTVAPRRHRPDPSGRLMTEPEVAMPTGDDWIAISGGPAPRRCRLEVGRCPRMWGHCHVLRHRA